MTLFNQLRKPLLVCGLFSTLAGFAGCVDINDAKVQVQPPSQIENYSRNVLEKCTPHAYPHRLIVAQTGIGSALAQQGSHEVVSEVEFEQWWSSITVLNEGSIQTTNLTQLPIVNWDQQEVFFYLVPLNNTCEKVKPYGDEITSDCYTLTFTFYRYSEGTNCGPSGMIPVFVFIYPKANIPMDSVWIVPTPTPTLSPTPKPTDTPTAIPTSTPVSSEDG